MGTGRWAVSFGVAGQAQAGTNIAGHHQLAVFLFVGFMAGDTTDLSIRQYHLVLRQFLLRVEVAFKTRFAVAAPYGMRRRAAGVAQHTVAAHADRAAATVTIGVTAQAVQGMGVDIDAAATATAADVQMPGDHQRSTGVLHLAEETLVMAGEAECACAEL